MFIIACVEPNVAQESHRTNQEQVDVDPSDTIETVKVKISLVFTSIDADAVIL